MTPLRDRIAQLIAAQGPIGVAEYMRLALTAYYTSRDPLGLRGDFVTAPEISQIFGELIGLWCVDVWRQLGSPHRFTLVELGPGRGTLMKDALRAARLRPAFIEAADVMLVEISPALRKMQEHALSHTPVRSLHWLDGFDQLESDEPVILIANEFFDALPIRQFVKTSRGWCERHVGLDDKGELAFALAPGAMPSNLMPRDPPGAAERAILEIAPARDALARAIGERIVASKGAALALDYGFIGPAVGDTLQAMKAHKFVPVLDDPGEADLTSHVDFASLAGAFAKAGAHCFGPVEQGAFLLALGARERAAALSTHAEASVRDGVNAGFARLTAPDQMGSLFKVLAAASPGLHPPGLDPQ